jgi:hypothetical protein
MAAASAILEPGSAPAARCVLIQLWTTRRRDIASAYGPTARSARIPGIDPVSRSGTPVGATEHPEKRRGGAARQSPTAIRPSDRE